MFTVLDKSYVLGNTKQQIADFLKESSTTFLLCDSFLFEVNKMPSSDRAKIYNKIACEDGEPNYELLPNINKLLKYELEQNKPLVHSQVIAIQPDNRLDHSNLSDKNFQLDNTQREALMVMKEHFGSGAKAIVLTCEKHRELFNSYIEQCKGDNSRNAAEKIAAHPDSVHRMLEVLLEDTENENLEISVDVTKVNSDWFFYRYAKLFSIACTSTLKRYHDLNLLKENNKAFKKIVNDYRDLEYILWASYIGKIQTKDEKLNDWLNILVDK